MRLDAFDYHLPKPLIAQKPRRDRSGSRMLVVDRVTGERAHERFGDLDQFVEPGDVVVVNRSRVIPARLFVRRQSGGRVELLVVEIVGGTEFLAIGSPLRRLKAGDSLRGVEGDFVCEIVERVGDREVRVRVTSGQDVMDILEASGHVPLPPYIARADEDADRARYQTIFAKENGSVAAPTAGLHFDTEVLGRLDDRGVTLCSVVLHVGLGTFMPLESEVVEDNSLHTEAYSVSGETLGIIRHAKASGHRVIAVGTTVTRVLETLAEAILSAGHEAGCDGKTSLFVYPGYEFKIVDGMITNFHLPQSSLLLLVCAFLGTETTLECYQEAVNREYKFYSYGDAMLIR
jgi:S-adenosylmethionine:tRNA ribosyltransferase-isomerase